MYLKNSITVFFLLLCVGVNAADSKSKSKSKASTATSKNTRTETKSTATTPAPVKEAVNHKINWLTWDEMVKLNEKNPKKIFIDFYTAWCGWCKVMDRNTFEDSLVATLMTKDFYCVKFDAERKDTIQFLGKSWPWIPGGRGGYHTLAAYFMQNQLSYPTFCVLTSNFELISPLKGYIPPPQFEPIISYLGQDLWIPSKNVKLEDYKRDYKSPRVTPWVQKQ